MEPVQDGVQWRTMVLNVFNLRILLPTTNLKWRRNRWSAGYQFLSQVKYTYFTEAIHCPSSDTIIEKGRRQFVITGIP
jgi:hypothetical protein